MEELHVFAEAIGLGRHWFHNGNHYDVPESFYHKAILAGAILIDSKQIALLRKN